MVTHKHCLYSLKANGGMTANVFYTPGVVRWIMFLLGMVRTLYDGIDGFKTEDTLRRKSLPIEFCFGCSTICVERVNWSSLRRDGWVGLLRHDRTEEPLFLTVLTQRSSVWCNFKGYRPLGKIRPRSPSNVSDGDLFLILNEFKEVKKKWVSYDKRSLQLIYIS